jgi:hypothetical protein
MSIDNYPDDIGNFSDCPESPFYNVPPVCEICSKNLTFTKEYDPDLGHFYTGVCKHCEGT